MERLTDRNADGNYFYPKCFEKCDGLGASRKCDNCEITTSICEKLGKYEDLEEQGRRDSKHTNADRIRNMSDDELAEFMSCPYMKDMYDECVHGWHDYDCSKCKLEWLQSEVE